jgi:hypothetical protein
MRRFPTEAHFASFLGLCLDNRRENPLRQRTGKTIRSFSAGSSVGHTSPLNRSAVKSDKSGWFHPKRRGGTKGLAIPRRESPKEMVRAEGLEPSRGLRPNGFSYHPRLSPPGRNRVRDAPAGLWSGLSLHRGRSVWCRSAVGAARLVSTPSPPEFSVEAWLGIAI